MNRMFITQFRGTPRAFRIAFAAVLLALPSFLVAPAARGAEAPASGETNAPIQQEPSALLCGVQKAVCYSGFRHGQHPDRGTGAVNPSDKETLEDLRLLNRHGNFSLIRLYDSRENSVTVLRLIKDHQIKMKVMLGAWLDAEVSNTNCPWLKQSFPQSVLDANKLKNAKEIESAIRLANQYSNIVVAVAVGNEALVDWNDHMVPVESVIRYVRRVKKAVAQPVTVADNYAWWVRQGSALAMELDFVSVHTYPIWEGKDIGEAMAFTVANLQAVRNALPNSRLVITEAGWATIAREFGPRAGEEKQERYYHDLYAWTGKMNITTSFFEAFDEDWKGEPNDPQGAEKHWGLFTVDRKAKRVMQDLYPDLAPAKAGK
jgi:exo-beta-1,3-glucanase (GH17 family)